MSALPSSSSSESHLYSFWSLLSSQPVGNKRLEEYNYSGIAPRMLLTPETLLLHWRHFEKRTIAHVVGTVRRIHERGNAAVHKLAGTWRMPIAKPCQAPVQNFTIMSCYAREIYIFQYFKKHDLSSSKLPTLPFEIVEKYISLTVKPAFSFFLYYSFYNLLQFVAELLSLKYTLKKEGRGFRNIGKYTSLTVKSALFFF